MAYIISSDDAIAALPEKPVKLPDEASLIKYDEDAITWDVQNDGGDGAKVSIKMDEIVLIAGLSSGEYLILTLSLGQPDDEEPFHLSCFLARTLRQGLLDRYLLNEVPQFIRGDSESSLDVIVSVRSGTGEAQKFYDAVLQPILGIFARKRGEAAIGGASAAGNETYGVTVTKDANTVKEFAQERWGQNGRHSKPGGARKKEAIILVAGDGGVVDLLNGASDPAKDWPLPTIALIPLGTGNALFHSLHKPHYTRTDSPVPSHLVLALRALLRGRAAPLPTFQVGFSSGSHVVNEGAEPAGGPPETVSHLTGAIVVSYGFHSQLVWESDTAAYRKHGDKRFGMVAQELLKESHGYKAVVDTSSSRLGHTRFNYILATMVSNLEKTFTISPQSKPLDGQLRLVHFGDVGGQRTMEIMMKAYDNGAHVGMRWATEDGKEDGVGYEAVEQVTVTTMEEDARWRKVCVDGTIVEIPEEGSVTVKKSPEATLQVLVLAA